MSSIQNLDGDDGRTAGHSDCVLPVVEQPKRLGSYACPLHVCELTEDTGDGVGFTTTPPEVVPLLDVVVVFALVVEDAAAFEDEVAAFDVVDVVLDEVVEDVFVLHCAVGTNN